MGKILPSEIQRWVTTATDRTDRASRPPVVRKYHTMLHSVFERALRDRVVTFNPCAHTELPKVIKKKTRTLTPDEYVAILAALPAQHRLMVETAINTGLRWGELIALKPRHLDLIKRTLTVEETIVEVSIKNSPTGARMLTKPYPKDNEPRTMGLPADLVDQLAAHITDPAPRSATTCCSPPATAPRSPATPSAPASGCPPSKPPASTSTSASTTSATPTPPGSSPAAPTSSPSWTAWATPRSPPPRNTSTPSPTPTPRTSTPSTGPAATTVAPEAASTPTSVHPRTLTTTTRRTLQPPTRGGPFRPSLTQMFGTWRSCA